MATNGNTVTSSSAIRTVMDTTADNDNDED